MGRTLPPRARHRLRMLSPPFDRSPRPTACPRPRGTRCKPSSPPWEAGTARRIPPTRRQDEVPPTDPQRLGSDSTVGVRPIAPPPTASTGVCQQHHGSAGASSITMTIGRPTGLGTDLRHRAHSGCGNSIGRGCVGSDVAQRDTYPPKAWNRLRPCVDSRQCGGPIFASREHVWRIPLAGSGELGHASRRTRAPSPWQVVAAGHRYPRVLHGLVVRRFGCGGMWTTISRRRSGLSCVDCAGGDRDGVVSQWHRHLREGAVNPRAHVQRLPESAHDARGWPHLTDDFLAHALLTTQRR